VVVAQVPLENRRLEILLLKIGRSLLMNKKS